MGSNSYSIVITHTAESDMDDIYSYITHQLHAEPSAKKLMTNIQEKIIRLKEFPLSCPIVTAVLPDKNYRKLIVDNYLIFYKVDEPNKRVIIARVLYASQSYIQILE